jgi:hypothetical protein
MKCVTFIGDKLSMLKYFLVVVCIVFSTYCRAQELENNMMLKIHSFRGVTSDTLGKRLNISGKIPPARDSLYLKELDSLQRAANVKAVHLDSNVSNIWKYLLRYSGSVNLPRQISVDSAQRKINDRFTPFSKQLHLEERLKQRSDSVAGRIQSVINDKTPEVVKGANEKMLGSIPDMPEIQQPSSGEAKNILPVENVPLPGVDIPLSSSTVINASIPKYNIPSIDVTPEDIKLPESPRIETNDIGANVQKQSAEVSENIESIDGYREQVKQVKTEGLESEEDISSKAEEKATSLDGVQDVKKGALMISDKQNEYAATMQRYRDKKVMQAELKRKLTNVANDRMNELSPKVKKAEGLLMNGKKITDKSTLLSKAVKKQANAMAGKPVGKRLVPGINFQGYNRSIYIVDAALQIGYHLSGRITLGVGGVYRLGFSKDYTSYMRGIDVYGGRIYGDFSVKKGFFFHTEGECLRTKDIAVTKQEHPGEHVVSVSLGLGKQYNITKRLRGNVLALYRTELKGRLPDQSKFNLRVGLNLAAKRKRNTDQPAY